MLVAAIPVGRRQIVGAVVPLSDDKRYRRLNDTVCVCAGPRPVAKTPGRSTSTGVMLHAPPRVYVSGPVYVASSTRRNRRSRWPVPDRWTCGPKLPHRFAPYRLPWCPGVVLHPPLTHVSGSVDVPSARCPKSSRRTPSADCRYSQGHSQRRRQTQEPPSRRPQARPGQCALRSLNTGRNADVNPVSPG